MNIEVPAFWYLDPKEPISDLEREFEKKLHQKVIFLELIENNEKDEFGRKKPTASIFEIS